MIELGFIGDNKSRTPLMWLLEKGVNIQGVGVDAVDGPNTHRAEYSKYLETVPDGSQDAVFSHLGLYLRYNRRTSDIKDIASKDQYGKLNSFPQIVRVLKPGGLLILVVNDHKMSNDEKAQLPNDEELAMLGMEKVRQYNTDYDMGIYLITVLRKEKNTTLTTSVEKGDGSNLSQGPGTPAEGQQLGAQGEVEARLMGLRNGIGQEGLVALAKEDPQIVGLLREALSRETDPVMRARIQGVVDAADNKKGGIDGSAPLTIDSPGGKVGGIDFRSLPIQNLGTAPLEPQVRALAGTVPKLNNLELEAEWRKIEDSVEQGNIPAAESIKEYLQASCLKGSADKDLDKVISCIADILRLEEEFYLPTEPMLIDILAAVESAGSLQELKAALVGNS